MYKYVAKDENFKTVVVEIIHNDIDGLQGGDGYYYYHLSEDGYNFVRNIQETMPHTDGYLLYSSPSGTPFWQEQIEDNTDHNLLDGLQGGGPALEEGYYHLTFSEHDWLTEGYSTGYWQESKGGTGQTSYTVGDILFCNTINTLDKLPIGTEGQVLTVISGAPSWQTLTPIIDHNLLDGLQGGEPDGYYHLKYEEYDWVTTGYVSGWSESSGGTGETSYNLGDLLVGNSSGGLDRLPIGQDGYQLFANGTTVEWAPSYYSTVHVGKIGSVPASFDGYLLMNMATSTDENFPAFLTPLSSIARALVVNLNQAPGVGETVVITLRSNKTNTALTVTIAGTAITGSNIINSIFIIEGTPLTMRIQTSSGAAIEDVSVSFMLYQNSGI